jgi:hypothetical protein
MIFDLVILLIWIFIGVVNLLSKKISKFSYFAVWILLVAYLIADVLQKS